MKTYKLEQDFILELYNNATTKMQKKIEDTLPELFKPKSGWYKTTNSGQEKVLMYVDFEKEKRHGFNDVGEWIEKDYIYAKSCHEYLAPIEEVQERLIEEAKRRGYIEGVEVVNVNNKKRIREIGNFRFSEWDGEELTIDTECVFYKGEWAEIIEPQPKEVTMAEIEKLYGHKIKIINNEK